jgi:nicotinate-nucleotide--dimethylbenzimidazole phosphoribosyltransferase
MSNWWQQLAKTICQPSRQLAITRQQQLTKPAGSLGLLELIAIDFAGWQQREIAQLEKIQICVFAGDHGIVEEGVSAFPQIVTAEMVKNFASGGAAIAVIAKQVGARFSVVNMGLAVSLDEVAGVIDCSVASGTNNFAKARAMDSHQMAKAMQVGAEQVDNDTQLFVGGEMGIGNSTSAAAIVSAALGLSTDQTVGKGTGVDSAGLAKKRTVIARALDLHGEQLTTPTSILSYLGGFEIAALVGAYIRCAQMGIPILVDGYISSAAALLACQLNPSVRNWMLFAHRSQEPGHEYVLAALKASPLLDLQLRLGEGSGAGVALPLVKMALALHQSMATFEQAQVSNT